VLATDDMVDLMGRKLHPIVPQTDIVMRLAGKVIARCREIAAFSEEPGRTTRTFLSPPMHDVHRLLGEWMKSLGMRVRVDAAGNLRGLHGDARGARLIIGSHLDTVPDAGAFDGVLGVVLGIALIELRRPRMAVEVVGFSEEEGVRFGIPFIGSRVLAGTLEPGMVAHISDAIRAFGLNPAELPEARFAAETVAYVEFHIEQGPVLDGLHLPLGIVDAIVGQSRLLVTFAGKANHAGTTPMPLRRDALAAAAIWISEVERYAKATPGLVATVGSLNVRPNAGNVIPGTGEASLDVRHACDGVRRDAVRTLIMKAAGIGDARGIRVGHEERLDQASIPMDAALRDLLEGGEPIYQSPMHHMTSGAGHDAMVIAPYIPSAMLFLRSPGGISHHPEESVLAEDVEAALEAGVGFISRLESRYV
jgi:allantoate deiminase